jgi:hypothetical protein
VELLGQQRQRGREHDRPADALTAAGENQERGARGQAAEQRRDREESEADREHELAAEQVGQRPSGEQQRGERQRIGVDHPLDVGEARVQVGGDLGQRDVDDRDVEQQHERRHADDHERPPLSLHGPYLARQARP